MCLQCKGINIEGKLIPQSLTQEVSFWLSFVLSLTVKLGRCSNTFLHPLICFCVLPHACMTSLLAKWSNIWHLIFKSLSLVLGIVRERTILLYRLSGTLLEMKVVCSYSVLLFVCTLTWFRLDGWVWKQDYNKCLFVRVR